MPVVRDRRLARKEKTSAMAVSSAAQEQTISATERLVARIARQPDEADLRRAALHLLDWLGCALIGRTVDEGRILSGGVGSAGWLAPAPDRSGRAFALGGLGSIFEMDDVHRKGLLHPGPVLVPVLFAFGAETPSEKALHALLAGYEVMVGIGRALGREHYRYFHPTSTLGGIGAAATAGLLLGLDPQRLVWALGTAGSTAGGLFRCLHEPVMTKPFHISEAARRGVAAADLAHRGLSGPRFILEGQQGLFSAMAADGAPDEIATDPDAPWLIGEVSFKPWPACRHVHAVIDAALLARDEIGGAAIARVLVETYADAVRICDRPDPKTMHDAKFSLQHAAAVVLSKGRPALDDFTPETLASHGWPDLRSRIAVAAAGHFSDPYPARFGAAVTIELDDGRRVARAVPDAWGDPENPMSEAAVRDKALMLIEASGASAAQAQAIAQAALDLADGAPLIHLQQSLARLS